MSTSKVSEAWEYHEGVGRPHLRVEYFFGAASGYKITILGGNVVEVDQPELLAKSLTEFLTKHREETE